MIFYHHKNRWYYSGACFRGIDLVPRVGVAEIIVCPD